MTAKTTVTVTLRTTSGVSEAALRDHHAEVIELIQRELSLIPLSSWLQEIYTDWEQSSPVTIKIHTHVGPPRHERQQSRIPRERHSRHAP